MATCSQCSRPNTPGKKLCQYHLDYYKEAARAWRAKQRAAGVCVICRKSPLVTKNFCESCRQRMNAKSRDLPQTCTLCDVKGHQRRDHKELGLCWHCKRKAHDRGLCKTHLRDRQEAHRQRSQQTRKMRQEDQVCLRCGQPSNGKTLCPKHLRYMREWQRNRRKSQVS